MQYEVFVLYALGLWRVVSLLANEDGPFGVFYRLRQRVQGLEKKSVFLSRFKLYEGYTCEWCLSLWIGVPAGLLIWGIRWETLLASLAGSTCVIVIKYVVQTLQQVLIFVEKLNKE